MCKLKALPQLLPSSLIEAAARPRCATQPRRMRWQQPRSLLCHMTMWGRSGSVCVVRRWQPEWRSMARCQRWRERVCMCESGGAWAKVRTCTWRTVTFKNWRRKKEKKHFLSPLVLLWSSNAPCSSCPLSFSFFIPVPLTSLSPRPLPHPLPVSFFFLFLGPIKSTRGRRRPRPQGKAAHVRSSPAPKKEKH